MFYAVFVPRIKQALDMPTRAQVEADFSVLADGVGQEIETAVQMALRRSSQDNLAVFEGEEIGSLPNGRVAFRPSKVLWCLPRDQAEQEFLVPNALLPEKPSKFGPPPKPQSKAETELTTKTKRPYSWLWGATVAFLMACLTGGLYYTQTQLRLRQPIRGQTRMTRSGSRMQPDTHGYVQTSPAPLSAQIIPGKGNPAAPTSLAVVSTGPAVRLSWVGAAGAYKYLVYRSDSPHLFTAQQVSSTYDTTWTDSSVQPLQTYYYWVAAQSNAGKTFDLNVLEVQVSYSFSKIQRMYAQDLVKIQDITAAQAAAKSEFTNAGSGFWLSNGDVATCYHVVKGNWARIRIVGSLGNPYVLDSKIVWKDKAHDLAVLRPARPIAAVSAGLHLTDTYDKGETVGIFGQSGKGALTIITSQITDTLASETINGYGVLHDQITMATPAGTSCGSPVFNKFGEVVGVLDTSEGSNGNQAYAVPAKFLPGY
ncbi:serine protease [Alicyclobacillus tolerans]|uniref:S1 family peptidase n=1 Tax=Alicyclobacillus tolerans TaxID=90970 RepID=UPI001F25477F|nr:serine protease [Alicyclobacillus tolerans]MCF8567559.1 serine protease [Alicyclobacillus tolerans]